MALKDHADITNDLVDFLGSNSTDFTDALLIKWIEQGLNELSRYSPHIVRETFPTTSLSKELDISEIKDLLWIVDLEFRTGKTDRQWRNFTRHHSTQVSMEIDFFPTDVDTGIDTAESLTAGETDITCDADATDDIPVGTIIRIENELYYVTATGITLTVVAGYGRSTATTHDTNKDIYIPELAYLYCAKSHRVPLVSDLAGEANADTAAGLLSLALKGLSNTGTIEAGSTFTIASDGTTTHYTLLKDIVLSSGTGTATFTPALAESVGANDKVTFDNSTLTPALETLLIELVGARACLSVAKKFIQGIPKSGRDPHRDYRRDGLEDLAIVLGKLEVESRHYQQEYTIHPRT